MSKAVRGGGLAAWSIAHPVGVSMIALALVVLGLFAMQRLAVDLLPKLIYPEIRVRVQDPGVPARIIEDRITRQLEEQLAITEDAVAIQSRSSEGVSRVDLSFAYGTDIDVALRDASTRLDRAKRFLPETIRPPIIYKRDPSQIPVAEFVIGSESMEPVALRSWVDYDFARQFLNLPGVAAVEVGGGQLREIQILPEPQRLAALGLSIDDLAEVLRKANIETAAGRLEMPLRELSGRTDARLRSVDELAALPIRLKDGSTLRLDELARVVNGHADERLLVRLDGRAGLKVSIQKQPNANTVAVVEAVEERLAWLRAQRQIPADMSIAKVGDQSVYVSNALNNATAAALSGTLLAMAVVYLFLGSLRRTLIIGSAIPLAVMLTFVLMGFGGLTFNIMTLGGLALGVGMLVDNTIVMLENIVRHQRQGEAPGEAGRAAAAEINGAIVAATSTNLAAVLPFLFVGGLVGLLFRELIFTISAAILASMVVALTLVPAWATGLRERGQNHLQRTMESIMGRLGGGYARLLNGLLARPTAQGALVLLLLLALGLALTRFDSARQQFLPDMDLGQVTIGLSADPGISLKQMDHVVRQVEAKLDTLGNISSRFTTVGGFIFGRTEWEMSNRASISVQLPPRSQRDESTAAWIGRAQSAIDALQLAGIQVSLRPARVRGIRLSRGDDDISLRIAGPELEELGQIADRVAERLRGLPQLRNVEHSAEELRQELALRIDRERTAALGLDPEAIGRALRVALEGEIAGELLAGDRSYEIRLRLPRESMGSPQALEELVVYAGEPARPLRLGEVARLELQAEPADIQRDAQRRIVEVSASLGEVTLGEAYAAVDATLQDLELPPGYALYDGGGLESLQEGERTGRTLLALALFLVLVVMAVQYESLRDPLVILLGVPFATIGVALALQLTGLPLSMPVWLGMIMLAGIVVNNAIVLVETIKRRHADGLGRDEAITTAARQRLRPILMTTLTTVFGMLPLALGMGEGAEMLQPLAVTLIGGLGFSLLVSLMLIPVIYRTVYR